jgi:NAD(P)-dependent dehydrogenase (short-subunit alcohol dehydrogenase family)
LVEWKDDMIAEGMPEAVRNASGKLCGKISVISGEGYGTGAAIAKLFREHGAKVAMMGSNEHVLESAVPRHCPDSLGYVGDPGSVGDLENFHYRAMARFGRPDILVVNAGGSASIQGQFPSQIPRYLARDVFHAVRIGLPFLADGAAIVLTTPSLAEAGEAGILSQAECEQAIRFFVRVFSSECSRMGIRVNAVVTSRTAMAAAGGQATALITEAIQDVARAALFLATDEARMINGEEIFSDRAPDRPGADSGAGGRIENDAGT